MEKKLLYIDEYRINKEMLEVEKLKGNTNELWNLLLKFGITDPEAIKNPIESVEEKLMDSMPSNDIKIPVLNIAKLVNKESEYLSIARKARFVVGHKYMYLLTFRNNYFDILPEAKETLTKAMTPYIIDKDEIEFANRIETMLNEAFDIADILGIKLGHTDLLRTFRASRVKGKTILSDGEFISRISKTTIKKIER